MKIALSWLKDFVAPPWDARELGSRLTMCGFELEGTVLAAPEFSGVQVAEIVSAERHPQADKLQVCRVATGRKDAAGAPEVLQIVCGAANARTGLKTALATVGASLPGGLAIKAAKLRGVESFGMLCSAKELGLADTSDGIVELPSDAPVGTNIRDYLQLDDQIVELNVTPNRGDAMSVLGIAREVSALLGTPLPAPAVAAVAAKISDQLAVNVAVPQACGRFVGRVIRGIDTRARTPQWMRERLRRAGLRSISPVVDITNYVMLELGQPMHAYDLAKLDRAIDVRFARAKEPLTLLDGNTVELDADMVVVADASGPVGLAGIMGGLRTAVSDTTVDVYFEAAWWAPAAIAGRGRRLGLVTDAGQRFERGVDPAHQARTIERATQLLVLIAGGQAGPTTVTESMRHLPIRAPVVLRRERVAKVLGRAIPDADIERTLTALQLAVAPHASGWSVAPPSHRFDIAIEADLIEELARVIGFEAFPEASPIGGRVLTAQAEAAPSEATVLQTLAARGYQETISFAFVDAGLQAALVPSANAPALRNPIASDLAVMRASLWPGLIKVALENQRRQQDRVRIVELGSTFALRADGSSVEAPRVAGLAFGRRLPERWTHDRSLVDFYDVKQDVVALLGTTGDLDAFSFRAANVPALHPGRSAEVVRGGEAVGVVGELHPSLVKRLDFTYAPMLFELDWGAALRVRLPAHAEISRFPSVRRDIAAIVDEKVSLSTLRERVTFVGSSLLRDVKVFDVYRGPGVETGRKSIALGLIFQDNSRTLTDDDIERVMGAVRSDLSATLGAAFRE